MSKSTIIELRQLDSSDVVQNGVYSSTLDPNSAILLEEGDQVNVKAIYLDTAESSAGFIHLENDVAVEMELAMYIQNYNKDQTFTTAAGASANLRTYGNSNRTNLDKGDNQLWWLAEHHNNASTTNWNINDMILTVNGDLSTRTKDITINFKYTPITPGAIPITTGIKIKGQKKQDILLENPVKLGFQCTGTASAPTIIRTTTDAELKAVGLGGVTVQFQAIASGEEHFQLQTFPMNFTISAGDYTPAEISKVITDKIASIEANGAVSDEYGNDSATNPPTKVEWTSNSPFLTSILENYGKLFDRSATLGQAFVNADSTNIKPDGTDIAGTLYMEYDIPAMLNEHDAGTGDPVTGYLPPVDRYVGANEVAMGFDVNENKLKFETIHYPVYGGGSSDTANDAVPCVEYNVGSEIGAFVTTTGLATKYSGIAFTKLEPQNFWEKQLGFNNICITPQYTAKLKYPAEDSAEPADFNSFKIECKEGINMTGGFPGLDVGVQHNNLNYSQPIFHDFNSGVNSIITTPDSTSIFSSRVFNSSLADEGYFLVEVSPNFNQNMVGEVGIKSKNTMSIVNRYYTQNSFTSDQGAGSIAYTHTGEPQLLSNLNVAVRNPDRSFVSSNILQPKNTIFIEVIKAIGEDVSNPKKQ